MSKQIEATKLDELYQTIVQWDEGGGKRSRRDLARRIIALSEQPAQQEQVAWECKSGGLRPLSQRLYEKQPDNIKRHYTRIEPAQQEPVGAEYKYDSESEWGRCSIEHHNLVQSEPHNWPGYQTRLLFAGPQPQPVRQPLTDDEVDFVMKNAKRVDANYVGWVRDQRREFARAIEAAHKITKDAQ